MKLYYGSYNNKELIGEFENTSEVLDFMYDDVQAKGQKVYYVRQWKQDGFIMFDYGNHTKFYFLEECK